MIRSTCFYTLACALLLGWAVDANAQVAAIAPTVGFDVDRDAVSIGAQGRFGLTLGQTALILAPGLEFFLTDNLAAGGAEYDRTDIQFNADLLYQIGRAPGAFAPYAGAGLAVMYTSIDGVPDQFDTSGTNLGVNLVAGASFNPTGALRPFAQARITIADGSSLVGVLAGLLFSLGG